MPGSSASSLSKFWKQRLKPKDCAYSRNTSRACAIWARVCAGKIERLSNAEDAEIAEEILTSDALAASFFIFLRAIFSALSASFAMTPLSHQHAAIHV